MSKSLMIIGLVFLLVGGLMWIFDNSSIGYNNPLDFNFKKGKIQLYFPLGSTLILSILLTLIFYWFKGE